ncbi:MAG: hypothetical protein ACXW6R_07130, partial [Candidatus Binatia bacterium]
SLSIIYLMQIRCTGFDGWICAVLTMFMFWGFSFLAIMKGTIRKVGKFYRSSSRGQGENRMKSNLLMRRRGGTAVAQLHQ